MLKKETSQCYKWQKYWRLKLIYLDIYQNVTLFLNTLNTRLVYQWAPFKYHFFRDVRQKYFPVNLNSGIIQIHQSQLARWEVLVMSTWQTKNKGACVICEPWLTGSRDLCELWKYVNHNFFLLNLWTKLLWTRLFVNFKIF